jgi:hypothetical protein
LCGGINKRMSLVEGNTHALVFQLGALEVVCSQPVLEMPFKPPRARERREEESNERKRPRQGLVVVCCRLVRVSVDLLDNSEVPGKARERKRESLNI